MPTLTFTADFAAPLEHVWELYDNLDTLIAVTPPTTKVRIENPPAKITAGSRFTLVVSQPPIYVPLKWETVIVDHEPPRRFVDEQGRFGPFAHWHHEHRFDPLSVELGGGTRLTDIVTYVPPFGILGKIADALFIRRQLVEMFAFRHKKTRELLGETAPTKT